ncbi:MAG: AI-2E family transporter, partial [Caldilineales bacterium]|nr:AI-2E family transporter [Caldilineales bacterium]
MTPAAGSEDEMNVGNLTISPITRALASIALVGFYLILVHLAAPVLVPVLFAAFLIALALPVFQWIQRRGVKRGLALFLLIALLLGGGLGLLFLALTGVESLQSGLAAYSSELSAKMAELSAALASSGVDLSAMSEQLAAISASVLAGFLSALVTIISTGMVSLVIVAFFLLESERFLNIVRTGAIKDRPMLSQLPAVGQTAVRYFGIRARLNLITGAGVTLICLLLGVDYPFLWGVLAFFLSFVPYIGLVIAMIPPTLLALAEFGWVQALIVVIGVTVINLLIENVLEPGYTGKRLSLSPTVVFLSVFFWSWLLG